MKILKYPLELVDEQTISIPGLRELVAVQTQESLSGQPVLWAMVDKETEQPWWDRAIIYIVATGREIKDEDIGRSYLSTFQCKGFVGHVYYELLND